MQSQRVVSPSSLLLLSIQQDNKKYKLGHSRKWFLQEGFHHPYHPKGPLLKTKGQNEENSKGTDVKRHTIWGNSPK